MTHKQGITNKVALVTGGSRGIGFQIALDLLKNGYVVYVIARSRPKSVDGIKFIHFDLSHHKKFGQLLDKLPAKIDLLVNNAGIAYKKWVKEIELNDFRKIIDFNFIVPVLLTKNLLPLFNKGSIVINISSDVSCMNIPGYTAYATSKAGLNRFTTTLAQENKDLQVYAILPSLVKTDMTKGMSGIGYEYDQFLDTKDISRVVLDIIRGRYKSGDLIVATNNYLLHWWGERDKYKIFNADTGNTKTSG